MNLLKNRENYLTSGLLFVLTITGAISFGILLAWMIPLGKDIKPFNSDVNKPSIKVSPLDKIKSWRSWMKTNSLYGKASIKNQPLDDATSSTPKKILYWNNQIDDSTSSASFADCPVDQCELVNRFDLSSSDDADELSAYDAVMFRYKHLKLTDLPKDRWSNQIYILHELDSPLTGHHSDKLNTKKIPPNFFNLTMTYRLDSDIVVPSNGWVEPLSDDSEMIDQDIELKKKMVAWMVDAEDCRNNDVNALDHQQDMIDHLRIFGVDVDIIHEGDCGKLESIHDCSKASVDLFLPSKPEDRLKCRQKVAEDYAFYFAIEEDQCSDYITEKFYSILDHPIIPVVIDIHGTSYSKVAPPHSFINAMDFSSVRDLADHLIHLSNDGRLYNEYFLWKKYFKVRHAEELTKNHLCNLCLALHNHQDGGDINNPKIYEDAARWWVRKAGCSRLGDHSMLMDQLVIQ